MKKFFFSLVALFCLLSQSLSAYSEKIGDIYYIFSGETATVTYLYANGDDVDSRNQIAYKGTITIPSTVTSQTGKTYRVTGIGRHAFSYCSELTNVKIGSNVKSIGKDAFCNCTKLKSVEFPNKQITTIEYSAFYQCESLEKIGDVSEVSTLGDDAFYRCYNIKNLNFSNKLTSIGYRAFCECKKLENVGDLSNVNSIGNIAFQYCESLRNGDNGIDLRNAQSLDANGNIFRGCKNLERIILNSATL